MRRRGCLLPLPHRRCGNVVVVVVVVVVLPGAARRARERRRRRMPSSSVHNSPAEATSGSADLRVEVTSSLLNVNSLPEG